MKSLHTLTRHKVFRKTHDPIWQLQLSVIIIMLLQALTDSSFLPYNKFIIIGFEAVLLVVLAAVTSDGYSKISQSRRAVALFLIALVAVINVFSLVFLSQLLMSGHTDGLNLEDILKSGFAIYTTNIFMSALLYWEMDGGGPDHRISSNKKRDFLFPQMIHKSVSEADWQPGFIDYLYLSGTNVTNFASADTVPISHRAKLLMMAQALISVAAVVLVAARAIGLMN